MFGNIREHFDTHGRTLRSRAFWALCVYRFGQWSGRLRFPPARWLTGKIYGGLTLFTPLTGVFLDRATRIGRRFHIVHPGMVYIHPAAVIGDRVGVMHEVTLGQGMDGGVPRVGNDVFIGAGAKIIGDVTVGDGSQVAANSLVVADVPPGMLAMGVPAKNYPLARAAQSQSPAPSAA